MDRNWDCIVVGGGAAGLSAALVLGRARRRTLLVDASGQSNRAAHGIGGLLGQDGRPAGEFYDFGRGELAKYPSVEVRDGSVTGGERTAAGFTLEREDGSRDSAPFVLLATGADYHYPDVPGIAQRWGRDVFHCPFCHGWEVRDRPLAVLDRGEAGVRRALLLTAWSDDVTLLANGDAELTPEDGERLATAGIGIDERVVSELRGPAEALDAVVFEDGSERPCGGLLVPVILHQRSRLAEQLGATTEPNPMAADAVVVDGAYATDVPGLYAIGDATGHMPSVANAVAAGSNAAAHVVHAQTADVAAQVRAA